MDELREECKALPGLLYALQMDVADDKSVADARDFVETKLAELGQGMILPDAFIRVVYADS